MYQIIDRISDDLLVGLYNNVTYTLKKINVEDTDILKQLMTLNNINVVKIFQFTTIGNDLYCVQEYIDGITLYDYVQTYGPMPKSSATQVIIGICNGLRDIHRLGIIHRDINPNNIIIDRYGTVKIIDFDISRKSIAGKVKDTQILGTQGYAAPEQYGFSQTSTRSDIYSLGVLINYITTLSMPNEQTPDGILGEIVEKCTQIDEQNRFESVDEIVDILINPDYRKNQHGKYTLPGFRSGVRWHKVIASIYYALAGFVLLAFVTPVGDTTHNLYFSLFTVFMIFVPVPIFTNYLGWANRFANGSDSKSRAISVVTGTVYLSITFLIFIILFKE